MKTKTFLERESEEILKIEDKSLKFERFFSLLYIYIDGQHADLITKLLKQFIIEAEAEPELGYEGVFYCSLAYIYLSLGKKDLSRECLDKARSRFSGIKSHSAKAIFYLYESLVSWFGGKRNDGFDYIFKSVKEVEQTTFYEVQGWGLYALATYQFDANQFTESYENYIKALTYFKLIDSKYGYARTNTGLASIKIKQGHLQDAALILHEVKDIYVYYDKLSGLSRVITDLGVIESKLGNYNEALKLHQEAFLMRLEAMNVPGQITSLLEMGEVLIALYNFDDAQQKLNEAVALSTKNNFIAKAYRGHELLATLFKVKGEYQKANEHLEKYFEYKTKVLLDESNSRIKVLQTQLLAEEASKREEIEKESHQQLRKAYQIIELKNTEILQSIDYAKRIQKTILPTQKALDACLSEMFVFYRPKDIVAGDFYWLHKNGHKIYFAVCDCTGHGVPGAFVSLICNQALNSAVADFKLQKPGLILDKVNLLVNEAFSMNQHEQINDGMDASLLMFDLEKQSIEWAGANNPLWIVDKTSDAPQLIEIKGNKQPIGKFEFTKPFTNNQLPLLKGNNYYIFSDGYTDQFGGENIRTGGKKFSQKRFRELLLSLAKVPMKEQEQHLENTFAKWKLEMEQIDDVLVAGISF